jgi:CubicO group peptidase (beta-lactamase class C family)
MSAREAMGEHADVIMGRYPPPPGDRIKADQAYASPAATRWFMQHVREVAPTANVAVRTVDVTPLPEEPTDLDNVVLVDPAAGSWTVAEMLAETSTDGILVLCDGKVLYEKYFGSLTATRPHLCHSITKSIASCVAANLVERGALAPEDPISEYVPELVGTAYGDARIRHLLDMTVGIRYTEDHEDDEAHDSRLDRLCGMKPSRAPDEPGSVYWYATTTIEEGEHGTVLHYVSLNTDVLGWVMERATDAPMAELIAREVWSKLGAEDDAYIALDGAGSAQLDGGFCCSLRDLARFGLALAQRGTLAGRRVVPAFWIDDIRDGADPLAFDAAPDCSDLPRGWSYRNCFWVGEPTELQAFMGLGMYGQMLYVSPEARVVVAKFSSQWRPADDVLVTRTYRALQALTALISSS